ncbi:MAG: hypothetical protein KKC68_01050 [Candidatus Thermoplasmatota archaeon]|nr:hypothetical protein [Candidatus Thermoplasmatota archaeon]MBU1940337.1 hypothetical protein [Candidatus Thermoplasmatota archaeon]
MISSHRNQYRIVCSTFIVLLVILVSVGSVSSYYSPVVYEDPYEYHTYQQMTDELQLLADEYPMVMRLESLGTTYEGRDIWVIELSGDQQNTSGQSGVLFMGAHHGNEKPSFEILIYFINHMVTYSQRANTDDDGDGLVNEDIIDGADNDGDGLVDEDPSEDRVRDVLNHTRFYVIPMVNPDGVEVDSRKNRAPNYGPYGLSPEITSYGVDLNRNYGFQWFLYYLFPLSYHLTYYSLDSGFNFRGEHPFSEEETMAVKAFVEVHDIDISISYHSYGEFILFPWTHTSLVTPDEVVFRSIGSNISRINDYYLYLGNEYVIPRFGGTIGTSENWLYGEQGILSYTIELCEHRAPTDPVVVEEVCRTHVGVNLYVAERSNTVDVERALFPTEVCGSFWSRWLCGSFGR